MWGILLLQSSGPGELTRRVPQEVLLNPVVLMVVAVLCVVHKWSLWTLAWG